MASDSPKNPREVWKKVVLISGFLDAYNFIMKNVRAEESTSLIIRGNFGSGKKTLISQMEKASKSAKKPLFTCITLNPFHQTDDYTAVRHIARELGIKPKASIQDTLEDISDFSSERNEKVVIVLHDFDIFCRQKQALLYCLTNLSQHGHKFNIIGITCSIDPLASLEKRIRSRLNANFYDLRPYKTKQEYILFAQAILGDFKFSQEFEEELEALWFNSDRSIRTLKKYLIAHCSWTKRGALTLVAPKEELSYKHGPDIYTLKKCLNRLTRPQLDLLILGVAYFNDTQNLEFSLTNLGEYSLRHNYTNFDPMSALTLKNASVLAREGLYKEKKAGQMTSPMKLFSIGVFPAELRHAIENNNEFRSLRLDAFWKRW